MSNQPRKKRPADLNQRAFQIVREATGEAPPDQTPDDGGTATDAPTAPVKPERVKDPAAVALGRKGGLKGGPARAKKLTAEERSEVGKKAAKARWGTNGD